MRLMTKFLVVIPLLSHTQILFGIVLWLNVLEVVTGAVPCGKVSKGEMIGREKGLWTPGSSQVHSTNGG